ncbi:MAG: hypothetical protein JWM41_4105 [Gemmatimonadetes bacterium]|nr:hypothetical protein [Gemmatimonadota bacterium]
MSCQLRATIAANTTNGAETFVSAPFFRSGGPYFLGNVNAISEVLSPAPVANTMYCFP